MGQIEGRILYKKIRYSKERVILEWVEKFDDQVRSGSIDDFNEPMDSFKAALQNLASDCIELCELPGNPEELEGRIIVTTINIKYETEKEIPGINISFKIDRQKRGGAYSITTPYQLLKSKDDEKEQDAYSNILSTKIHTLINEATFYKTGIRKQIELEFDSQEEANNYSKVNSELTQETNDSFIVRLDQEQTGLLKPGVLVNLTKLANDESICKQNGVKGIYHINPKQKSKSKDPIVNRLGHYKNIFTLKRNGNILILKSIFDKNIEEYDKDMLNPFMVEIFKTITYDK